MSEKGTIQVAVVTALAVALSSTSAAARAAGPRTILDARIVMRDGVELSADIWLPAREGRYPALLVRTPYVKALSRPGGGLRELLSSFTERGYVGVYQDVRGRGDSDGVFLAGSEGNDGYDTIEWIARQPWSNGKVCMMGASYLASVQWAAARKVPPHLKCIAPTASGAFQRVFYIGGAFSLDTFQWVNATSGRMMQPPFSRSPAGVEIFRHRPLLTLDKAIGRSMPLARKFLTTPDPAYDPVIERQLTASDYRKIRLPGLHVTGWFDAALEGAVDFWQGMMAHSPARDRQYLLIGPWTHDQTFAGGGTRLGEMEFTPDSVVDVADLHARFLARFLKESSESFDFPRARLYITGANRWRDFDAYPPKQSRKRRLYLHSAGQANSLKGDGALTWEPPGNEPVDSFTFDPRQPVPAFVATQRAAVSPPSADDRRPIEQRQDVLVYTSKVLDQPLEIIGRVTVELFAATDGRDTDFTARLIDVYPDGRAVRLGSPNAGIIRARFRNGFGKEELLTPGKIEKYRIFLVDIGHTFLPGHRVRLEISSSAYPLVNPNQNTGNPIETDTAWRTARQTIHHDKTRPSALVLPVFPGDAPAKP